MGHAVYYSRYPESSIRKVNNRWKISFWDELVRDIDRDTDWESGYHRNFTVYDHPILQNENLAETFLENNCNGYHDGAVRYYISESTEAQKKKEKELNDEINQLCRSIYNNTIGMDYLGKISSKLITCEECGSKLNRQFLVKYGRTKCPVCGSDTVLPISIRDRIKKQQDKLELTRIKLREFQNSVKPSKNAKVNWLVKVEYHV